MREITSTFEFGRISNQKIKKSYWYENRTDFGKSTVQKHILYLKIQSKINLNLKNKIKQVKYLNLVWLLFYG